jgi:hypothetical protein
MLYLNKILGYLALTGAPHALRDALAKDVLLTVGQNPYRLTILMVKYKQNMSHISNNKLLAFIIIWSKINLAVQLK